MYKVARVFARKTSMCPTDEDAYFDTPDMFTPKDYDEVWVSVTFSWDIERGHYLKRAWDKVCKDVQIGGVALDGESFSEFAAGLFLKEGITITSRGCPNKCSFCLVRQELIEFDTFPAGNIIQDNNILACSNHHLDLVFGMLKNQKAIEFKGGLEANRITPKIVERLKGLRIKSVWVACDTPNATKPAKKAIKMLLKAGFTRNHIYCYVLIGKDRREEENRLYEILNAGAYPFAQLYQPAEWITYSKEWCKFQREWARPAIMWSKINKEVICQENTA